MYRLTSRLLTKTMGFTKTILTPGNGQLPTKGQSVTVHCTGYGKNNDLNVKFGVPKFQVRNHLHLVLD